MKYSIKMLINKFHKREVFHSTSYSQCGEDLIIDFILKSLKIFKPTYLDLGTNHPMRINNTYYFYQKGCRGVLVEPDPNLYSVLKKYRNRDKCINMGVGVTTEKYADFYLLTSSTLNTFSKDEAERYVAYGSQKILDIIKIPLININELITTYMEQCPDFISLDVEGLDFEIVETIDFLRYRPKIFCIETLDYTEDKTEKKLQNIIDYMLAHDYFVYADTYINSIFVDRDSWNRR